LKDFAQLYEKFGWDGTLFSSLPVEALHI